MKDAFVAEGFMRGDEFDVRLNHLFTLRLEPSPVCLRLRMAARVAAMFRPGLR